MYKLHKKPKDKIYKSIGSELKKVYMLGINDGNIDKINKGAHYYVRLRLNSLISISKTGLNDLNILSLEESDGIKNGFDATLFLCNKISILDNNICMTNLHRNLYNYTNVKDMRNQMKLIMIKFKKIRKELKIILYKLNKLEMRYRKK